MSDHFTEGELLRSTTATVRGFNEQFNPPVLVLKNLRELCVNVLEPLRIAVGKPIRVTSGYRCDRLNGAVGGKNNSQHKSGQAADLEATAGMTNSELFHFIKESKLPFDQLIWEYGDGWNPAWVHVSYSPRNRRQVLYVK